jgi:hypothetical protein
VTRRLQPGAATESVELARVTGCPRRTLISPAAPNLSTMKYARSLVVVAAAVVGLTACSSHQVSKKSAPPHVERRTPLPKDRVIVLGRSIGAISLGERRTSASRALGPGKRLSRGVFSYFGGRLLISYWFHDQLTSRVNYIKTTWSGFHTRTGLHVGISRRDLHLPAGSCANGTCGLAAGKGADAPGTGFGIRHGQVAWIAVGYS